MGIQLMAGHGMTSDSSSSKFDCAFHYTFLSGMGNLAMSALHPQIAH
jgi:hypothetical protein